MKRTTTFALLLSLALAGSTQLAAQKQRDGTVRQGIQRDVVFDSVRAISEGDGVLVRWQVRAESGVLGYNVYRIADGSKEKVNSSIILGTAYRGDHSGAHGESHQVFDLTGKAGVEYVVEGLRFDESRFYAEAVPSTIVPSIEAEVGTSADTLRQVALSKSPTFESRSAGLSDQLSNLVASYTQEPNLASQFVVASKPGAKIAVKKDGFYRVTASELGLADFPLSSDSTKWRLFTDGREQAIIVAADRSYIEFYGQGVDLPETDSRIYYLVADTVVGKRIGTRLLRQVPGTAPAKSFPVTMLKKDRTNYREDLSNGDEENFLGDVIDANGWRVRFNLPQVDFTVPTASIKVTMFGLGHTNHHRLRLQLNGNDLPDMTQFGQVHYWETFTFPTEFLVEGQNELDLKSVASFADASIVNKIEVTYKRGFTAESGSLSFSTPGSRRVDVGGFDSSAVRVFDVTFDGNPVQLTGIALEEAPVGFRVRIPSSRMMAGYAVEDTGLLQSHSVTRNAPSTLSSEANSADMIIISHSDPAFLTAAATWAEYRRSAAGGSISTRVVSIEDVYDEFNYGMAGADAIRNFLKYATEDWAKGPEYVLLLGDASADPRGYTNFNSPNLVPSRTVSLVENESFSDELLGDFNEDDFSSIAVGRIPARTPAQIAIAFNKMVRYEAVQATFARGNLFVNDTDQFLDFAAANQRLIQRLPAGTPFDVVSEVQPQAQAALIAEMNRGRSIVTYSGHGSSGLWAGSGFFQINNVPMLNNADRPSVMLMFSCLNGNFTLHERTSLSEELLFSETGGAVATWASTGSTTAELQSNMADRFYQELAGTTLTRIGDLTKTAKTAIPEGRDVRLSWALLGDPAMRMP